LIFFKEENEEKLIPKIPLMVVAIVEQIFGKKKTSIQHPRKTHKNHGRSHHTKKALLPCPPTLVLFYFFKTLRRKPIFFGG
jgi:hypothetical protein